MVSLSKKQIIRFFLAFCLAFLHILLAGVLLFYGTVIDPTTTHQILNLIAVIMLLPFSLLMFIPFVQHHLSIPLNMLMFGFWFYIYFKYTTPKLFKLDPEVAKD